MKDVFSKLRAGQRSMLRGAAVAAFLVSGFQGVAWADPEGRFNTYQTMQGCTFHMYEYGPPETNWWQFRWSGACTSGQPINGTGVLTRRSDYEDYDDTLYEGRATGTMVNGVWEGEVREESLESENGGPWLGAWRCGDGGGSRCNADFYTYSNGCAVKYRYQFRDDPYQEIIYNNTCPAPPGGGSAISSGVPLGGGTMPASTQSTGSPAPVRDEYDSNFVPYAASDALVPVPNNPGCVSSEYVRHSLGTHFFEVSSTCSTPVFFGIGPADYSQRWRAASQAERQSMDFYSLLLTGSLNPGETKTESHNEVENNTVGQLRVPKVVLYVCKTEKWASQEVGVSLSRVYYDHELGSCMGVPNVRGPAVGTGN